MFDVVKYPTSYGKASLSHLLRLPQTSDSAVFERIHYFDKRNAVDQVSMIYNAGSRYEEFDTAGVTHALRAGLCYGVS